MPRRVLVGVAAVLAACGSEPGSVTGPPPRPIIDAATIGANPHNVLSALVAVRVRHADSVAARFHLNGAAAEGDSVTPAVPAAADSASVPVLGLVPSGRYLLRVVAYGAGGLAVADSLEFTTDSLPSDLPRYTASGPDPSPGFVVFAAGQYGLVIDNSGRVVWYRRFPNGPGLNFQPQPTGRYYARPPTPEPADLEPWVEIDELGNVLRTLGCAGQLRPRFHDLIAESDGTYWLMCDETRAMDLTTVGGTANAQVTGTVVQHVSSAGALLFQWSAFDHFEITDLDAASRAGPIVNWTHGNALDLDDDGGLLISFRSLNEVTRIDLRTGAVAWRMGGSRNQFVFQGTSDPAFSRQHGVRFAGPGQLMLLDNLGDSLATRGERYVYDERLGTARLIGSYGSSPAVTAQQGGTTQDLPGGRTLIAYGSAGRVEEYDAAGRVVWRIEGDPGYVFRAQRIGSLYRKGVSLAR